MITFGRINAIFVDYDVARQITYCDNLVSFITGLFQTEHSGIDILTGTIKLGGVNMYYSGLPILSWQHTGCDW